jgi:hypothetical protein
MKSKATFLLLAIVALLLAIASSATLTYAGIRLLDLEPETLPAIPKRLVPPFRVPHSSSPLTTPASAVGFQLRRAFPNSGLAKSLSRALRAGGRAVSRVATPLTIAEGLYDIGVLTACAF